jgi:hypothetical protein
MIPPSTRHNNSQTRPRQRLQLRLPAFRGWKQVPVGISCHSTHFRFCLHPCTDLRILGRRCRGVIPAVDGRGLKFPGLFPTSRGLTCEMSYQLSDLKLVLVAVPVTLANQSDAQVQVELCGLRATSRRKALLLGVTGLRPLVCALGFCGATPTMEFSRAVACSDLQV